MKSLKDKYCSRMENIFLLYVLLVQKFMFDSQKTLMRRKLKPMSRGRGAPMAGLVQRTILPKNSEYIAIIPMMPGTQIPNSAQSSEVTQTIVGHPINGIQTQPVQMVSTQSGVKTTASIMSSPSLSYLSTTIACK